MIPKTTPTTIPDPDAPSPPDPNIQALAEQGWIHLSNLQKVALFPFAHIEKWQALSERLEGVKMITQRLIGACSDDDMGTNLFFSLMEVAHGLTISLESDLEQAKAAHQTENTPLPLITVAAAPNKRRPTKKETAGI